MMTFQMFTDVRQSFQVRRPHPATAPALPVAAAGDSELYLELLHVYFAEQMARMMPSR
jgi:hypothetical protein